MFASLEVLTESTAEAVIAIPQSALVEANGQSLVFVRNGQRPLNRLRSPWGERRAIK